MRTAILLAAIFTFTGCSSFGSKQKVQPSQSQTIHVAEAYPTKMGAADGPAIGSNSLVAGEPSARRTTVRR